MTFLESSNRRAAIVILVLGAGILMTLSPYASGLIGGLVLYVIFAPVHGWMTRHRAPPSLSAGVVVVLAFVVIVGPMLTFAGLLANQAQGIATGVVQGPLLERLKELEVGGFEVGPRLAGLGEQLVAWLGSSAFGLIGTATRIGLNLTIALFVVYYLLLRPRDTWDAVKPYIPFSPANAELLRLRFRDVTISTVVGTGLIAVIQGALVALAFWVTGLSNWLFWGAVTVVLAILPVVGSGLVWGPGAISLFLADRPGAGFVLLLLGGLLVGNVDVLIRPAVYRRFAQIHPLVTLIGAIGGVGFFGLLGILIGPLALSYFFELIRMYREEYLKPPSPSPVPAEPAPRPAAPVAGG